MPGALMSAVMVSPSRNASSVQAARVTSANNGNPASNSTRTSAPSGRKGDDAGGQTIAHTAGDGGVALEDHVFAADANKHFA